MPQNSFDAIGYIDYPYVDFESDTVKGVPCNGTTSECSDIVTYFTPLFAAGGIFVVFYVILCIKSFRGDSFSENSDERPPATTQTQRNVVLTGGVSRAVEIRRPSTASPVTAASNSNTVTQPSSASTAVCLSNASTAVCLSCASRTPVAITLSPEDNIVRSRVKTPKTDENPPSYEDAMSTPPYDIAIKK